MPAAADLLIRHARLAACTGAGDAVPVVADAHLAVRDGRIAAWGAGDPAPGTPAARVEIDAEGRLLTPGLVDCHTHLVYAGHRAAEFEQRLQGASYASIARAGGGILGTVRATRAADEAALEAAAARRLRELMRHGVTAVEIKSGYGLTLEDELKCLRVARRLGERHPVTVRTTLLAAHALPPEFAPDAADAYIELVAGRIVPEAARLGLADAVDAFCDTVGFTAAQTRRVFEAARAHGLPVKLHAEQLSNRHGAALAAAFGALSADHLEHVDEAGVAALARAGTVAVLLPGAYYALRDTRPPPVGLLRLHRVPMAVATDCNPGTSPTTHLPLMLNMACTLFGLTPAEALLGATRHAARALGLAGELGTLAPGLRADLCLWDAAEPAELVYPIGSALLHRRLHGGVEHPP